ncbi:SapB/AmfS family lanthipeptide [Cystobacter fuscus]|uniref:SapB/AmfS family lanthipeptide n=1 Tax=Cystobacter fuscus TaxID=43 RepID=UPI000BB335DC
MCSSAQESRRLNPYLLISTFSNSPWWRVERRLVLNNVLALQKLPADTGGEAVGGDSADGGQEATASNLSLLDCEASSSLSLLLC